MAKRLYNPHRALLFLAIVLFVFSHPVRAQKKALEVSFGSPADEHNFVSVDNDIKQSLVSNVPADDDLKELLEMSKETVPEGALRMTLEECVALALRRNVNIEIAYINRILQKFNLVTNTTYHFIPNVSIQGNLEHSYADSLTTNHTDTDNSASSYTFNRDRTYRTSASGGPEFRGNVPGGATYSLRWTGTKSSSDAYARTFGGGAAHAPDYGWDPTNSRYLQSYFAFSFSQPLLKSFGYDYSMATSRKAKIGEKINLLNLKGTIISQLTSTIRAYRSLLQAKWNLTITENSLKRSQQNLEMAKAKVELGKLASMDLVQYESDLANRQLSLETSKNSYNTARLELLRLLDLKSDTIIEPVEKLAVKSMGLDYETCKTMLLQNSPSYLSDRLSLLENEINLMIARRDRLWDLNLDFNSALADDATDTKYPRTHTKVLGDGNTLEWSIGLSLSFPLFGSEERGLRQAVLSAQSTLYSSRIQFRKTEEDLLSELKEKLTSIAINGKQLDLARHSTKLAQQKLEVEQTKLNYGLTTPFQVLSYENDLVTTQQDELATRITYLNALTALDQFLGTTLSTWGIGFKDYRKEYEPLIKNTRE